MTIPRTLAPWIEALCAEQCQRWQRGEQTPVECYLQQHPALAADAAAAIDLVYNEILLRQGRGERPRLEEYLQRFPQWAAPLRRLFEVHEVLELSRLLQSGSERNSVSTVPDGDATPLPAPAAHAAPLAVLAAIPGYELLEEIGRGGMGAVLRGCDATLGRELAVKLLRPEYQNDPAVLRRFLEEARIGGQLQHPGIVPIYALGRCGDGRPYFTMKLVQGQTLAELLRDRSSPAHDLPRLVTIFAQVCQTLAYAHSKGVLHRDLKPSNIMVGAFGEVQVMDWGLAKVLAPIRPEAPPPAPAADGAADALRAALAGAVDLSSQEGEVQGTLAYMAPEQARGEVARLDARCDVFGLGALLCEILTGQPPYAGSRPDELWSLARRGELSGAFARLDSCGAAAELVQLAKVCLAAQPEDRPRDAAAVAEAVTAYQAGVQERLRQAELEAARAQVQAREERKRRRLALVLAASLLLLVAGGVAGWWWRQRQQEQADQAVVNALAQAQLLEQQAQQTPLEPGNYHQALAAARVADQLAEGASAHLRRQAADLVAQLEQEETAAQRDRRLLDALLEVRGPREGPKYSRDDKGLLMALAEPTVDEQFAAAFRSWGLDVDATPTAEAAARLKGRPQEVVTEVVAALDEWASERQRQGKLQAKWQRLEALAAALDDDPGSQRRELRALLQRDQLPVERALGVLSALLRPVPIPVEISLGRDRARLRQLVEQTDPATEPVLGLLTLTRALRMAGEEALAERLLRAAIQARPHEVVLYHTLGQLLTGQQPPRWAEAVEFYRAARALRPNLGVHLARALLGSGQEHEGLSLLKRLVKETPGNPYLHFQLGNALSGKHDLDGAIVFFQKAIELDPKLALAHYNLGLDLYKKGQLDDAIEKFRRAIDLDPKYANAHTGLGIALHDKGRLDEALAEYRRAIELDPKDAKIRYNLGSALRAKGRLDEAIAEYRAAIDLDPKDSPTHHNLGVVLHDKGQLDEAIAEWRQAIELDPKAASAHSNLGSALYEKGRRDEALAEFRRAIELDPKDALAHSNLGNFLRGEGQLDEAIAECRRAIELDPKYALAYCILGLALWGKGQLDEAIAEFRRAIELDPKLAKAHGVLGDALLKQGRFAEAQAATRRCLDLLSPNHPLRPLATQQLRQCERLLQLNAKLPAILKGEAKPTDTAERLALAQLCQQHKRLYAASARFYAEAFAADPRLAADLRQQHRYNAACVAALAAAGQGADADRLEDQERARLRQQARDWLRADLDAWIKVVDRGSQARPVVQRTLRHWQQDPDLASLREPTALAKLPEDEQQACRQLWASVTALLKKAAPEK